MVLAVVVADIVCPLIFASILSRVAATARHPSPASGRSSGRSSSPTGWPASSPWPVAGGRLAGVGRLRAVLRRRAQQRLPPPAPAQLPLAHGPPGRRGHLLARQLLLGLRRDGRRRLLGPAAGRGRGPLRHRACSPSPRGRPPWPCWSWCSASSTSSPAVSPRCERRPRSSRTTTPRPPAWWPTP